MYGGNEGKINMDPKRDKRLVKKELWKRIFRIRLD